MEGRGIGALVGQAVGDALGVRYEFLTRKKAEIAVKCDKVDNFLPILGGGILDIKRGQVTDTELSLIVAKDIFDLQKSKHILAIKFIVWFNSGPLDVPDSVKKSFSNIPLTNGLTIYNEMKENAMRKNLASKSNSCLAKLAPIAIFNSYNNNYTNAEIAEFVRDICKLTNPNPELIDACVVYVMSIKNAIKGYSRYKIWEIAKRTAQTKCVKDLLADAKDRKDISVDNSTQGYFGHSIIIAFRELLYGESFEESLTHIMELGGDTNTNGCITGSLLGSFYGYTSIPREWRETVIGYRSPRELKMKELTTRDLVKTALKLFYH